MVRAADARGVPGWQSCGLPDAALSRRVVGHRGKERTITTREPATAVVCPRCGARLIPEPSLPPATADAGTWLGRCEKQHWWLQSLLFGWIPIDPGAMAKDGVMTTRQDDGPD